MAHIRRQHLRFSVLSLDGVLVHQKRKSTPATSAQKRRIISEDRLVTRLREGIPLIADDDHHKNLMKEIRHPKMVEGEVESGQPRRYSGDIAKNDAQIRKQKALGLFFYIPRVDLHRHKPWTIAMNWA